MLSHPTFRHRFLFLCLTPALAGALAAALFLDGRPFFAAGALLLASVGFLSNRYLEALIEAAERQKSCLDQQLLQSQKLAAIGELSSGIAHEINNPLAIIGQEAQWMQHLLKNPGGGNCEKSQWQDDLEDSLQEIVRQIDRCKDITHKLLDFARRKEPLMQGADINRLLEDMVRLVEKETVHRNINISRNYAVDLPLIFTDPPLMRQVVLNLLNNAVHAVGRDGHIAVATGMEGNEWAVVEVNDTGCGIPQQDLNKIFDPFFTTKPQGKGTGLGLSICHGIVTRLGGRISVESVPGEGTKFSVHLPLDRGKGGS